MKLKSSDIFIIIFLSILLIGGSIILFLVNRSYCGDGICKDEEKRSCVADCDWCGDAYCQENEKGKCSLDCNWCGDAYCQQEESCSSCETDCGDCKATSFCGDGFCNPGECKTGCLKDCKVSQCIDGICDSEMGEDCKTSPSDCSCPIGQYCKEEGGCSGRYCGDNICESDENCLCSDCVCESLKKCFNGVCKTYCGNGVCEEGYETKSLCPVDCGSVAFEEKKIDPNTNYPLIFVHGHSTSKEEVSTFSINAFTEFQDELNSDKLYLDKGIILPNSNIVDYNEGELGRFDKPISFRTTYYIGNLDSSGTYIRADESERSIKEYGQRLGTVVDLVLHHTGKKKVNIIAHSMGGLVSRAYIRYYSGDNKVDKLIMIGTPNHGIYGWLVAGLCGSIHPGQECEDMQHDNDFILNLNKDDETYGTVKYYTIAGSCDDNNGIYHDEVIRVNSVKLNDATNVVVEGSSVSGTRTFHGSLISPSKVPRVYNYVNEFLR